ncbi:MAG: rhomboid family intramembrane serine protease [Odoribacteraceae bacterium]|jgi:membrane associated rhomboid family serine protease|nr:rhomboid family intramembrane serine protease [Odoribacteraceae bacterium]
MSTTVSIIIATVLVSIACFNNEKLFYGLAFSAARAVRRGEWYRLITHGFVHADWMHLFVNMFTFYSFGLYIEKMFDEYLGFGAWAFPLLYFGGMVIASLHDVVKRRDDAFYTSVGASGAVSAVLFASIFMNPWSKIYLFAAIPIPGILFGGLYLFYCQYMARRGGDNINHNAHFYGAVYGLVFPALLEPGLVRHFLNALLHHA